MNSMISLIDQALVGRDAELALQVEQWANQSSHSDDLAALKLMAKSLAKAVEPLDVEVEWQSLAPEVRINDSGIETLQPLGPLLVAKKRPAAAKQVLLGIHYDTVYPATHSIQRCRRDGTRLVGPGVADAKGGIVVMLAALRAFESAWKKQCETSPQSVGSENELGWELFLNPDEELGSPGSRDYFQRCRKRFDFALLFEPALPGGAMVRERKGSGNYSFVITGRAAHAGRDFSMGRNAVVHACRLADRLDRLNGKLGQSTINISRIAGGGATNIVPDRAVVRLNVRVDRSDRVTSIERAFADLSTEFNLTEGFRCERWGGVTSPPKASSPESLILESLFAQAAATDPIHPITELQWVQTGGVCDGNKLAAAGIPNIDTCGPVGGELHSEREWLDCDTLVERALRTAKVLAMHAMSETGLKRGSRLGS